ncbi:MAG: alanine racemase [Reichenbachiella sp.]|uniref:alanine racemase n=1 Tax=Reichenbachiella sp. TaxID=2184521 RepID=UPI003265C138
MYKVTRPTLLLDKKKAIQNIERMAKKAKASGVNYRPHFKTHFSKEIGEWYREYGVISITVSSIDMAVYFAGQGWNDITIAFPINVLQIEVLKHLSKQVKLGLVVESIEAIEVINTSISDSVDVYIKVDTGYRRTGVWHKKVDDINEMIQSVADHHVPKGLLAHFGHTYRENQKDRIISIFKTEVGLLNALRDQLGGSLLISVGDTPSASIMKSFEHIDEIRPGNLVFYDVMQAQIGSCRYEDIAVCLAAPVVAVYPDRSEVVVHGGAVHLSKESLLDSEGKAYYGVVVLLGEKGWSAPLDDCSVISLSQEHGKITMSSKEFEKVKIGSILGILPVHSCLTANLMKEYTTLRGERISTLHQ